MPFTWQNLTTFSSCAKYFPLYICISGMRYKVYLIHLYYVSLPSGFPNVGKSSVVNSLKEARVCNVGPMRGLTKLVWFL